jgi:hypothetical protein
VAVRSVRVVERAEFEAQLAGAPGAFLDALIQFVSPVLMHQPANIAGPFGIRLAEDGLYELEVAGSTAARDSSATRCWTRSGW